MGTASWARRQAWLGREAGQAVPGCHRQAKLEQHRGGTIGGARVEEPPDERRPRQQARVDGRVVDARVLEQRRAGAERAGRHAEAQQERKAMKAAREGQGPTLIEAFTYRMGAHTTTDDPTRYRLSAELESWKLKDPIARVEVYLRRNGLVDDEFIDGVKQEADELGHHLREGCKALPDPQPLDMFDYVYAEETEELRVQRESFAEYLATFEGAH